ncbi:MAG: stage II sporulation protein M [Planctomycetota bacterium]|nr:stage II sporulation protein M [Planctomycetota bacterium]
MAGRQRIHERTSRSKPADERLERFAALCGKSVRDGLKSLTPEEVEALPRLYRYSATRLAHVETVGRDPAAARALRARLAQGHALLFQGLERDPRGLLARLADFYLREVPRTIRAEWRPIAAAFVVVYGLAIASFLAVRGDLDLAWSLLAPDAVAQEISQLQETAAGQPFRGNFTFGLGESPSTAGLIMAHNMSVGVVFFASGLIPPLFAMVLGMNGLMVGTYTAVAAHWGQGLEISSILWCHGTLEIQALVLAGAAGLVLVRGLVMPGPWSRTHALRLGARRAWRLLAAVFPLLFCAGLIEGFISPHATTSVRLAVAVTSGLALVAWVVLGGREARPSTSAAAASR